jgi:hypothetical protein
VGFGGRGAIAFARVVFAITAPVVVGVPEKGPWLVAPVTSELTLGYAEGAVVWMACDQSVPNMAAFKKGYIQEPGNRDSTMLPRGLRVV